MNIPPEKYDEVMNLPFDRLWDMFCVECRDDPETKKRFYDEVKYGYRVKVPINIIIGGYYTEHVAKYDNLNHPYGFIEFDNQMCFDKLDFDDEIEERQTTMRHILLGLAERVDVFVTKKR